MTAKIKAKQNIYRRICRIIEEARHNLARSVNFEMVKAYWLIGKEIVEEEQKGEKHASYGDYIIKNLSVRLSGELGEGFSEQNLRNFRQFYLMYKDREIENLHTVRAESDKKIRYTLRSELSWSHYRILMRVEKPLARSFHEIECSSLLETLKLLSTPGMVKSIHKARKEIKEGKTYSMEEVFGG